MNKLIEIMHKPVKTVLGLMSGTSVDGIDAAVIRLKHFDNNIQIQTLGYETFPYSHSTRQKILDLCDPTLSHVDVICHMNFYLGELFANAALTLIDRLGMQPTDIDLIGSHGQTIYHRPKPIIEDGIPIRSTLQIGEAAVICERTGIVTVSDFRVRDMAAGGEGAPLVSYVDQLIFSHPTKTRVIQNIGGIGNLTLVSPHLDSNQAIAFDTGPGNMLIDAVVTKLTNGKMTYDKNGEMAARGQVSHQLLDILMTHPYLKREPPKTTGREEFGFPFAEKILQMAAQLGLTPEDTVATVTAFTAKSIAFHYDKYVTPKFGLDEIIVGGGGCHNPTLLTMLKHMQTNAAILTHEDFGIPNDAKEAIAFAVLANETINANYNNLPTATGATHPVIMGKISQ